MKQIELTDKHRSKLTEMCKKLFPEIRIQKSISYSGLILPDSVLICDENDLEYISTAFSEIHWFEFCIIHLAKKILDNSSGDISTSELGYFSCGPIEEIHPIDYLYEQFKTLENGK